MLKLWFPVKLGLQDYYEFKQPYCLLWFVFDQNQELKSIWIRTFNRFSHFSYILHCRVAYWMGFHLLKCAWALQYNSDLCKTGIIGCGLDHFIYNWNSKKQVLSLFLLKKSAGRIVLCSQQLTLTTIQWWNGLPLKESQLCAAACPPTDVSVDAVPDVWAAAALKFRKLKNKRSPEFGLHAAPMRKEKSLSLFFTTNFKSSEEFHNICSDVPSMPSCMFR